MNTTIELDTEDLTCLELTGNRQEHFALWQVWTRGHARNGDSIVMYLDAARCRQLANAFAALATTIASNEHALVPA